jgi:guanylate kinase
MAPTTPLLIVLSAPSGGGKTTLCDQLLAKHSNITRAVTCTTRAPRAGEENGVHYHFLAREVFLAQVAAGNFLEHASVYENLYGTWKSEVLNKLQSGRHVILNIDVQGASSIRAAAQSDPQLADRLISVFLTPPSMADLEQRLNKRASESAESRARRLQQAATELAEWSNFDYLIISTSIAEDLRRMEVVLEAELMRQQRAVAPTF